MSKTIADYIVDLLNRDKLFDLKQTRKLVRTDWKQTLVYTDWKWCLHYDIYKEILSSRTNMTLHFHNYLYMMGFNINDLSSIYICATQDLDYDKVLQKYDEIPNKITCASKKIKLTIIHPYLQSLIDYIRSLDIIVYRDDSGYLQLSWAHWDNK